jgi:hypothetical protein
MKEKTQNSTKNTKFPVKKQTKFNGKSQKLFVLLIFFICFQNSSLLVFFLLI